MTRDSQPLSLRRDLEGDGELPDIILNLVGEWVSEEPGRKVTESWSRVSADTLEGIGQTIDTVQGSRVSVESLRLVSMAGDIFYIAKVKHNSLPVAFRMTESTSGSILFENPEHDFPKKIAYVFNDMDHMRVHVSNDDQSFELVFARSVRGSGPVKGIL